MSGSETKPEGFLILESLASDFLSLATTDRRAIRTRCPCCERYSVILAFETAGLGWLSTCLRCGDSIAAGELMPRPFLKDWRERRRKVSRNRWRSLGTHAEFEARKRCTYCGGPLTGAHPMHATDCPDLQRKNIT